MSKKINEVQPQPETGTSDNDVASLETNVVNIASVPNTQTPSLIRDRQREAMERAVGKVEMLSVIRTGLQEVAKLKDGEASHEALAEEKAAGVALTLYQARKAGTLNADEETAVLGETFGWKAKPKGGGNSKTPFGYGEFIRKRVRRVLMATGYIGETSEDAGSFFDALDTDDVATIVHSIEREDNPVSIWTAYNQFTDMKKKAVEGSRPSRAFDPKHIIGLAASLGEAGAVDMFAGSVALQAAYAQLASAIAIVDSAAAQQAAA